MQRVAVPVLALCLLLVSCAGGARPGTAGVEEQLSSAPTASLSVAEAPACRETGTASWCGSDLHGRRTASGEIFDMFGMSAAHRTLPLGTTIRITNTDNSRSIVLKVNDRGPFARSRVLEVSYGAARELGFAGQGTATVRIETVGPVDMAGTFTVQAGVFSEEENAKLLRGRLQRKYETVVIVPFESNIGRFFRVRVGAYTSEEKAERIAAKLVLDGLEPLVLRKD